MARGFREHRRPDGVEDAGRRAHSSYVPFCPGGRPRGRVRDVTLRSRARSAILRLSKDLAATSESLPAAAGCRRRSRRGSSPAGFSMTGGEVRGASMLKPVRRATPGGTRAGPPADLNTAR